MMLKFLADNDFSERILRGVKRLEPTIDFLTASEGGIVGLPDPNVLERAADAGRILVTHDRRTMPRYFSIFVAKQRSPGVLVVPQSVPIGQAIQEIVLIWSATTPDEWENRIQTLPL